MSSPEPENNESPGVPGFNSWRVLYWFVFGSFLVMVSALALFTAYFA